MQVYILISPKGVANRFSSILQSGNASFSLFILRFAIRMTYSRQALEWHKTDVRQKYKSDTDLGI